MSQEKGKEKKETPPPEPPKPKTSISLETIKETVEKATSDQVGPILEEISNLKKDLSKSQPKTEDVVQHVKDCPDCYSKLWELFNSAPHECVDCEMPLIQDRATLDAQEIACPSCKSKEFANRIQPT